MVRPSAGACPAGGIGPSARDDAEESRIRLPKILYFCPVMLPYVDIHTHHPTGQAIELRTAGIHPWEAGEFDAAALEAQLGRVQALGETGLDRVRGPEAELQLRAFRAQLELARKHRLPVVLHCVKAFEPLMRELAAVPLRAVIFHGFIGSRQQAAEALKRGYCLSYGVRSFASPRSVEALRATPADRLFLETDDQKTPIEEVYARAAELRKESVERLQRCTLANYERIFGEPLSDESTL